MIKIWKLRFDYLTIIITYIGIALKLFNVINFNWIIVLSPILLQLGLETIIVILKFYFKIK